MRFNITKAVFVTGLVALLGACAPVIEYHGYFPDQQKIATLEEGEHSQSEVEGLLGSPSIKATFDENTWFYVNSQQHTYAWKAPVVVSRNVLAIKFNDETRMIESINRYTIEDGRIIAFSDDKTPTRGRELSFIEQLLGNVGRISTDTLEEQQNR